MHTDARKMREKWAAGEVVIGPFVQMPAAGETEIFGLAGFDFSIVDLEQTSGAYHLTSEMRNDGLIDPTDTRNTLGMALLAVAGAPIERTPGGVLRI